MEQTNNNEAEYAKFKPLIESYYAAWSPGTEKLNIEVPAQFYAKDDNLLFWDIFPPLEGYVGWEDYKVNIQKNPYDNLSFFKVTAHDDLRVMRRGDIAWTTVTFHASGKLKEGKTFEVDARQTFIWERRNGQWLIVHEHMSIPLPT